MKNKTRLITLFLATLLSFTIIQCTKGGGDGDSDDGFHGDPGPTVGTLDNPCREDATCDEGLLCSDDICVESAGTGGGGLPDTLPSFAKSYGRSYYANSIQQTTDGGYIAVGYYYSAGSQPAWILKLKSDGTIDWQKKYYGNGIASAKSVQQTSDGGYIVAGRTGTGSGVFDFLILKLKSDGTAEWQKTYDGYSNDDQATSIMQTSDGKYVVLGKTLFQDVGQLEPRANFWVLKLHADGTPEWQKRYGGDADYYPNNIAETSNGYIAAGYTSGGSGSGWLLKLDTNGTPEWQKSYSDRRANSVQPTKDSGFIIALSDRILKLDKDGTPDWEKTYGGPSYGAFNYVQQTTDGGYIVAGLNSSLNTGSSDYWILKLNEDGTVAWQKAHDADSQGYTGGSSSDEAKFVQQTTDAGYIVSGRAGGNIWGAWILKLKPDGTIDPSCPGYINMDTDATSADASTPTVTPPTLKHGDTNATITDLSEQPTDASGEMETWCSSE